MSGYAVRRPVLNAYLVRQRDRRRLRELLQVLGVCLGLGACLLGYVWLHQELVRTGYRVDELEDRVREAVQRERALLLEAQGLERPELIERRAIEELGMQLPSPDEVVYAEELR